MIIALGSDHGGFSLKEILKTFIQQKGYTVHDVGTYSTESVDYPDIAYKVAKEVAGKQADYGIMIDGAGIGSSIAANKVPGIRAAVCNEIATAYNSKEHNNANVLVLGSGIIGENVAKKIVETWLTTEYAGGRHQRRIDKIMQIESLCCSDASQVNLYDKIRSIVISILGGESQTSSSVQTSKKSVITEDDILNVSGSELRVKPGTIITSLAKDTAKAKGIKIIQ